MFAPKYRRKVFYEGKRLEIGAILRELCRWKGVEIIETEVCPDHIQYVVIDTAENEYIRIHANQKDRFCSNRNSNKRARIRACEL